MGPSREACDRCHAMKTRCVRSPRSQVCVRCTRLGFSCHYSPPGRTGRPAGSKQNKTGTAKGSKSSPRSTYQKPSRCSGTTCHTQEHPVSIPGQISPALTAHDPSHSQLPINLSDVDIFGSESSFSDGANSMFFMDDLFQDVLNSNITGNTSAISTTPPSTISQEPLDHSYIDSSLSSRNNSVTSAEEPDFVLLDAQAQLLSLVRVLSSCSSVPQEVEEIYRITDTFVRVVDDVAKGLDRATSQGSSYNGSITHMLLSSCYMSLIQAFESLVGLLRRELGPNTDPLDPSMGIELAQTPPPMSTSVPYISVGSIRLAMPHRAVAEINLHLVGQAVQHLKSSISRCAAKLHPRLKVEDITAGASLADSSSICAFTKIAMDELTQREHTLFSGLQMQVLQ